MYHSRTRLAAQLSPAMLARMQAAQQQAASIAETMKASEQAGIGLTPEAQRFMEQNASPPSPPPTAPPYTPPPPPPAYVSPYTPPTPASPEPVYQLPRGEEEPTVMPPDPSSLCCSPIIDPGGGAFPVPRTVYPVDRIYTIPRGEVPIVVPADNDLGDGIGFTVPRTLYPVDPITVADLPGIQPGAPGVHAAGRVVDTIVSQWEDVQDEAMLGAQDLQQQMQQQSGTISAPLTGAATDAAGPSPWLWFGLAAIGLLFMAARK